MTELTYRIGAYSATTRTVPVRFLSGDIRHVRDVNAVLKEDGSYDRAATRVRVEEVARGVAAKIGLGVIAMPQAEPKPEPTGSTQASD